MTTRSGRSIASTTIVAVSANGAGIDTQVVPAGSIAARTWSRRWPTLATWTDRAIAPPPGATRITSRAGWTSSSGRAGAEAGRRASQASRRSSSVEPARGWAMRSGRPMVESQAARRFDVTSSRRSPQRWAATRRKSSHVRQTVPFFITNGDAGGRGRHRPAVGAGRDAELYRGELDHVAVAERHRLPGQDALAIDEGAAGAVEVPDREARRRPHEGRLTRSHPARGVALLVGQVDPGPAAEGVADDRLRTGQRIRPPGLAAPHDLDRPAVLAHRLSPDAGRPAACRPAR